MNPKRTKPRHSVIQTAKLTKKGAILKEARGTEPVTNNGNPIRLSADVRDQLYRLEVSGRTSLKH